MISREEVIYAYRLLFGREPESDEIVTRYATELKDTRALREVFLSAPEFQEKLSGVLPPRPPRLPFSGPAMQVELEASNEKLTALFDKVSARWHEIGITEPYWSVVTNESYVRKNFDASRETFYSGGEAEMKAFDATLRRAGLERETLKRCLELGCGVGRVTAALAGRFTEVIGADISATHLRVAEDYLKAAGCANVTFRHPQSLDDFSSFGSFDLLYSRMVLQHNPPPVIGRLLRALLSQLAVGGVAFLQIPTYRAGYRFAVEDYLAQDTTTALEMHVFPQVALLDLIADEKCRILEIREDDSAGISATMISNTVLLQKTGVRVGVGGGLPPMTESLR